MSIIDRSAPNFQAIEFSMRDAEREHRAEHPTSLKMFRAIYVWDGLIAIAANWKVARELLVVENAKRGGKVEVPA